MNSTFSHCNNIEFVYFMQIEAEVWIGAAV